MAAQAADGSACPGSGPSQTTTEAVRRALFAEQNPAGPTVGSLYAQCSYGKTRLTAANSLVVEPVTIGCAGVRCAPGAGPSAGPWGRRCPPPAAAGAMQRSLTTLRCVPLLRRVCSNGVNWTLGNSCEFNDFDGWAVAADEAVAARGIDLAKYKHRCACRLGCFKSGAGCQGGAAP